MAWIPNLSDDYEKKATNKEKETPLNSARRRSRNSKNHILFNEKLMCFVVLLF